MQPSTDWSAIKTLFLAALDLPAAQRRDYVAAEAGADLARRDAVLRLLAHDDADDSPLDDGVRAPLPDAGGARLPERVGPYRPERVIGHGGMGVVLLATRQDGEFRQQVALKLIRGGGFDRELVARFRREREILARLSHPHIARLTDGGVTDDGLPWYAMEYIEGQALGDWCDAQALSLRQRVRLFLQVLDAVDYAHRNLVVHRDLKPTNILVTATAEGGQVRLLDFGIAKLLDESEGAGMTGSGARLMTPDYAAPEQILGEPIGTATDVYALGVVLFELLTARLPYPGAPGGARVAGAIVEAEPERLRQALSRRTGGSGPRALPVEEVARRRGTDAAHLRAGLDRDLEQVVALALAKRPEHRYPSVAAMAEDLRSWLDGRPLRSRPAELRWRIAKFVRRHRVAVTASLALVLALFAGAVATLSQWRIAREEAEVSDAVRRTLTDIFAAADPENHGGAEPTVRDVLDHGVQQVQRDTTMLPRVRVPLLSDLAQVYSKLGQDERAAEIFAAAEQDADAALPEDRARLNLRWAVVETERSNFELAEAALTRARALPAPPRDRVAFDVELELAEARLDEARDRPEAAMARLERLLRRLEAESSPRPAEIGYALNAMGSLHLALGQSAEGESVLRRSLEYQRSAGASELTLSSFEMELGRALRNDARAAEALAPTERALAVQVRVLGEDHVLALQSRGEYAVTLQYANRFDDAEREFERTLAGLGRTLGEEDPIIAVVRNNFGVLLYLMRRFEDAEPQFEYAHRVWRARLGPDHERTLQAHGNLAGTWVELGRLEPAREALEALVRFRRERGTSPNLVSALLTRGLLAERQGRVEAARDDFSEALAIGRELAPDNPAQWSWAQALLGRTQRRLGDTAAARQSLEAALAHYSEPTYGTGGPRVATTALELARTLEAQQVEPDRRLALARRSLEIRREKLGEDHADTREARDEVQRMGAGGSAPATGGMPR